MHRFDDRRTWWRNAISLLAAALFLILPGCVDQPTAPTADPAGLEPRHYTYPQAIYRNHIEFGAPYDGTSSDDYHLSKRTHYLSYNRYRGGPNWVSWNLNKTHYGDAPRSSSFSADQSLPSTFYRVVSSDYTNSGYSRGHMVRSEERTWSTDDNKLTFLMTNVLPQTQALNGGPWLDFERYLQSLAQSSNKEIYVISGGNGSLGTLKGEGKVTIPRYNWKIAVILPYGKGLSYVTSNSSLKVIAIDVPNVDGIGTRDWTEYRTTVDRIERYTGYDFLHKLPDSIETYWESRY